MVKKKKDLPLVVLVAFAPYLHTKNTRYRIVTNQDVLLRLIDTDPDSDFYFLVKKHHVQSKAVFLKIEYVPQSKLSIGNHEVETDIVHLVN